MYLKKEKQQENMNHNININNPICIICKKLINIELEKWSLIQDFNGKNLDGKCEYHLECWQTRFKLDNSQRKKQMVSDMLNKSGVSKILEKMGLTKNEVVI